MPLNPIYLTTKVYRVIVIIVIIVAALLVIRLVNMKISQQNTIEENNIIFDKLRATAKLVIWEEIFWLGYAEIYRKSLYNCKRTNRFSY